MARTEQSHITISTLLDHPAYIWVGFEQELQKNARIALQKSMCPSQGCTHCMICTQIANKQHPSIMWLAPDPTYTKESLDPLFHTISFTLQPEEHLFFVIQKAHVLNLSCSNSLLKALEEPPTGYHFLLLAEHHESILPTIKSRCLLTTFTHGIYQQADAALKPFFSLHMPDPSHFLSQIERSTFTDHELALWLDNLFEYWLTQATTYTDNRPALEKTMRLIDSIAQAKEYPPMPGSAKLFLKNLYLQYITILS